MSDTGASAVRPRILCVGAYERDNFGDLLFQLVTQHYLADADVVYAAPIATDMREYTDSLVPAFGPLLSSERFDAVWTVGGEVGGTSVEFAYKAALGAEAFAPFRAGDAAERRRLLALQMGEVPVESPYLPRVSAYPLNLRAAVVINSAGVAAVKGLAPLRKAGVRGILREATRISVRDRMSSDVLREAGIEHSLDPDLVHSIAIYRPRPDIVRGEYILLQVGEAHLRKYTREAFAQAIIDSPTLADHEVRMFLAGTAPGHDSAESYQRIIDLVHEADPTRRMSISTSMRPWDRVDEIAGAKLWIGGSLHGRIVACAYGTPRVSWEKRKLDEYSQTWDPDMPWGVTPETMDESARRALQRSGRDDRGRVLGEQAHANILAALDHVLQHVSTGGPPDRLERIIAIRTQQWNELAEALGPQKKSAPVPSKLPLHRRARRRLGRWRRRLMGR